MICMVLMMAAVSSISTEAKVQKQVTASKSAIKKKQHQRYVKYIKAFDSQRRKEYKKAGAKTGKYKTYFAFVDIDKNGTDECIVKFADSSAKRKVTTVSGGDPFISRVNIYTIKKNKVKTVLKQEKINWYHSADQVCVYKSRKAVGFGRNVTVRFYDYKNGSISKKETYIATFGVGVPSSVIKEYRQMTNNITRYTMHLLSNSNLKKYV